MVEQYSKILICGLRGTNSHVKPLVALEGLTAKDASRRPDGKNHSIWEILHHMVYWQDLILNTLKGKKVKWPKHAEEGWMRGSGSSKKEEWDQLIKRFRNGLRGAERIARNASPEELLRSIPDWQSNSIGTALQILLNHNSYHLGQIVYIRKLLKRWPPPKGGDTW